MIKPVEFMVYCDRCEEVFDYQSRDPEHLAEQAEENGWWMDTTSGDKCPACVALWLTP